MKQGAARACARLQPSWQSMRFLFTGIFFLVLHVLALAVPARNQHRVLYAVVAILLLAGQAVVLDA